MSGVVASSRRVALSVASGVVVATLAACAQVPRSGAVVEVKERPQQTDVQGQYVHPKGPQPDDSRAEVVTGFLVAMTATPLETTTAQEFLSARGRVRWNPQRVMTYRNRSLTQGGPHVVVRLHGADEVGVDGQWQGSVAGRARKLDFPMVREDGQWRIARAPNALIVPRSYYDQQYQEAEVYFFDPSGRILVPEPVHVQQGTGLASALMRALARGPGRSLGGVVRSFLPDGLTPGPVPVSGAGVADVTLKGTDVGPLSRRTTELIVAQLSWTLRQDPSITSFRLSIDGRQVDNPAGSRSFRLTDEATDPHDPAVSLASSLFYGLRKGRLVSGPINAPSPVDGAFGVERRGIGAFAVSLNGDQVAGVAPDQLLVAAVRAIDAPAGPPEATPVMSGPHLLRPAWDFAGRLWEIQNAPSGAAVYVIRHDKAHRIPVPGITGENVRRFLISRDGSRIVAVLRGPATDRIVVSRLRYDTNDRPVRGTRARHIPWVSSGTSRIRDIGWTSPTTIEVLDQLSRAQAEARILNVDGSTAADEAATTTIPGRALGLATSPVGGPQTPYAVQRRSLYDLAQVDTTAPSVATVATPGLHHITYAG